MNGVVTAFSWLTDSTISISPAPANGAVIEIRRVTPKDQAPVNFTDGSTLREADLDLLAIFSLYCTQEAQDGVETAITQDSLGAWNGNGRVASNFAAPVNPSDLVTKDYVESQVVPAFTAGVATAVSAAQSASISATSAGDSAAEVAGVINNTAILTVADDLSGAGFAFDLGSIASPVDVNPVAPKGVIRTVAENIAAITNVSNNIPAITQSVANAAASASDAATSLANFRNIFYGALSADPSVDPSGNPPTAGDIYFNSTSNSLRIFASPSWVEATATIANGSITADKFSAQLDLGTLP